MATINNITTSTATINNYTTTYIPTKACNKCDIIKELTEFYKCKTTRDGYLNKCTDCVNILRREYVKK